MRIILIVVAALVVIAAGAVWLVGFERLWVIVAGQPDLGPVTFESLARRSTPNDALACPPDVCDAKADIVPPIFAIPARNLRVALGRVVASEPNVSLTDADDLGPTERYVQRSAYLRFPDTIVVRYFDRPEGRSTLALYSRAQLGFGDMGVNRARIERWLDKLRKEAPIAP